ncbi:hypothetical protein B0H11DRAFT_2133545, partial [Mycena galericulata]
MCVFFCKYNDPLKRKIEKLDLMVCLATTGNVDAMLNELKGPGPGKYEAQRSRLNLPPWETDLKGRLDLILVPRRLSGILRRMRDHCQPPVFAFNDTVDHFVSRCNRESAAQTGVYQVQSTPHQLGPTFEDSGFKSRRSSGGVQNIHFAEAGPAFGGTPPRARGPRTSPPPPHPPPSPDPSPPLSHGKYT